MIDERMMEQASLYALGALNAEEVAAFEAAMRGDAELRELAASLAAASDSLAGAVPRINPPAGLKDKIMARVGSRENIVPLPVAPTPPAKTVPWFPWAIAACLAVLCGALAAHEGLRLSRETRLRQHIMALNQMIESLENATNSLQKTVLALQETNRIENMRIAFLGSLLSDQPKAVAVSLWDADHQDGVFVVQNLKQPPKDKDYQLWVIDPQYKTPVDAGVFQVDDAGNVRFQFKAKLRIGTANKFAVTEEEKGGSPTPKGQMVMVGG